MYLFKGHPKSVPDLHMCVVLSTTQPDFGRSNHYTRNFSAELQTTPYKGTVEPTDLDLTSPQRSLGAFVNHIAFHFHKYIRSSMFTARQRGSTQLVRSIAQTGHCRQFSVSLPTQRGSLENKKVAVQLLRDFPGLGYRGEIVNVAAGRMRNQLHRGNGAAYVVKGEALKIPVVAREKALERQRREAEERAAQEAQGMEVQEAEERERMTGRMRAQSEMMSALENLTNLNFNLGASSESAPAATAAAPAEKADNSSLFFLENSLKSLPGLISFPASLSTSAATQGFISPPVTRADLAAKLTSLVADIALDPAAISFKVLVERGQPAVDAGAVDFVGTYTVSIQVTPDRVVTKKLRVVPREAVPGWEQLRRPFGHPLPGSEAEAAESTETAAPAAEPVKAAKKAEAKEEAPVKKTFEWENDFINKMKK